MQKICCFEAWGNCGCKFCCVKVVGKDPQMCGVVWTEKTSSSGKGSSPPRLYRRTVFPITKPLPASPPFLCPSGCLGGDRSKAGIPFQILPCTIVLTFSPSFHQYSYLPSIFLLTVLHSSQVIAGMNSQVWCASYIFQYLIKHTSEYLGTRK